MSAPEPQVKPSSRVFDHYRPVDGVRRRPAAVVVPDRRPGVSPAARRRPSRWHRARHRSGSRGPRPSPPGTRPGHGRSPGRARPERFPAPQPGEIGSWDELNPGRADRLVTGHGDDHLDQLRCFPELGHQPLAELRRRVPGERQVMHGHHRLDAGIGRSPGPAARRRVARHRSRWQRSRRPASAPIFRSTRCLPAGRSCSGSASSRLPLPPPTSGRRRPIGEPARSRTAGGYHSTIPLRRYGFEGQSGLGGCSAPLFLGTWRGVGVVQCEHADRGPAAGVRFDVRRHREHPSGVVLARTVPGYPAGDHGVGGLRTRRSGLRPGAGPGRLQHQFPLAGGAPIRASWPS